MTLLSQKQQAQWDEGTLTAAYGHLGAHPVGGGVRFGVWAPSAEAVSVVGDFNDWDAVADPMKREDGAGFWKTTIGRAQPGHCYKYAVTGPDGSQVLKSDPFAFFGEEHGQHASIVYEFPDFEWDDADWMKRRGQHHQPDRPMAVYEVHLGSWRHEDGEPLTYRQLADTLVPYVKEMGFTHIELMPIMEHPFTPSWGYQVTGFFAPTSRYGRPEAFMAFVNACHRAGLGVILDWVPGHFPKDEHGLRFFDGTPLYEHDDPRRHEHGDWGTHNFDYGKAGVRSFLLSNAAFWCDKYHVDGFRVDAVASMLYLDYSKGHGQWLPNEYGGNENLGAIRLLRDFNKLMDRDFPGVVTVAEESTAWPGVTAPAGEGGLGFDYKWNMGWMNDTIYYFSQLPEHRGHESHHITFPRTFAFSEQFILPFSHDEVVHLKKSLWSKMPGPPGKKFAQLRLLGLFMMGWPGKKLLFMGSELAEREEWSEFRPLHWELLEEEDHRHYKQYVQELLKWYRSEPALFRGDCREEGFDWLDLTRKEEGLFSFRRRDPEEGRACHFIFNFSGRHIEGYWNDGLPTPAAVSMDSEAWFGGAGTARTVDSRIDLGPFQGVVLQASG